MRVLLDEDLNTRLQHAFSDEHRVETVAYRGWKGLKNGALLTVASEEFDVFVTTEKVLSSLQPGDVRRIHPPD